MSIELRIVGGARAGQSCSFDKPLVTIGREPRSDLRFDPQRDLEVSTQHAELREAGGQWTVADRGSTNGTFVNGVRLTGPMQLKAGDVVAFGRNGPTVEVHSVGGVSTPGAPVRRPTEQRVAVAVQEQTRNMRLMLVGAVLVLSCVAAGSIWQTRRQSAAQLATWKALMAQDDSATSALRAQFKSITDTAVAAELRRQSDSIHARMRAAPGAPSAEDIAALRAEVKRYQSLAGMDRAAINTRNSGAVAFVIAEFAGQRLGGTAFCISPEGLLVTNRHLVKDSAGLTATRVTIQFADTRRVLSAHVKKVGEDSATDLALIQIDEAGRYPTIGGISRDGRSNDGDPIVAIGFPEGLNLPMAGDTVKTSLEPGAVTKTLTRLLQLDLYAAHGSSGSPVFGADGNVDGVVYGGLPESGGHVTYAVPGDKLVAFLANIAPTIIH